MRVAMRIAILMTGLVMLGATSLYGWAPAPGGPPPPYPKIAAVR